MRRKYLTKKERVDLLDKTSILFLGDVLFYIFWLLLIFSFLNFSTFITDQMLVSKEKEIKPLDYVYYDVNGVEDIHIIGGDKQENDDIKRALQDIYYPVDYDGLEIYIVDEVPIASLGDQKTEKYVGQYTPGTNKIHIDKEVIRNDKYMPGTLANTLAHEIGHFLDSQYLIEEDRENIRDLRAYPPGLSWYSEEYPWEIRPSEDFAETFAFITVPEYPLPIQTVYKKPNVLEEKKF